MSEETAPEVLIEGIRQGEEAAVAELQERLARKLLPYIHGKIGRKLAARIDAEDILQQTITELVLIIRNGDRPIRDLDPLSLVIARNMIGLWARRRSIHFKPLEGPADDDYGAFEPPAGEDGPHTQIVHQERKTLINDAIETLSTDQAAIVRLRFFHGKEKKPKFHEIAELVGMTPQATEKAYLRAKQKIREYLERHQRRSDDSGIQSP
jgi:RNA polymerase sigma factor (sigma-70 family)